MEGGKDREGEGRHVLTKGRERGRDRESECVCGRVSEFACLSGKELVSV